MDHLANEDKNNDVNIIGKSSEAAEYLYITICGKHDYRRHKPRVLLSHNQASTLFAEMYISNGIVACNFSQKHSLIVVNSNTPRHFRLDVTNREPLLALDGVYKNVICKPFGISAADLILLSEALQIAPLFA